MHCPDCGAETNQVHGYDERIVADVPFDARRVQVLVDVRRLRCSAVECDRRTFREQFPGVLERYQRRTPRLIGQVGALARESAGRTSVRALAALGIGVSRHTVVRVLLGLPLPAAHVPRVFGVDDFAPAKRRRYAPILISAETRERIDVLPDQRGHARGLAARTLWDRGGVPGRLGRLQRGDPAGTARCGAMRRSPAHLAQRGRSSHKEVSADSACWAHVALQSARVSGPRPTRSAGTKSTTCWTSASGCSNAPGGATWR